MTSRKFHRWTVAAFAVVALLASAGFATAGDADHQVIKIEKRVHCEGEECDESPGAAFIEADGEAATVAAEDFEWLGDDGQRRFMKRIHHGAGKGGFLGVGLTDLTPELRGHFGVPEDSGVMVSKIVEDSPAERAGLQVGDIITLVDGESIRSGRGLASAIGALEDGASVALELWRDGRVETVVATVEERERPSVMTGMMPRIHVGHGDGSRVMMHHGDGHEGSGVQVIKILCDDDTEECEAMHGDHDFDFDCGGAEACEVTVRCDDGGCSCMVNGEAVDCSEIPGVPSE